MEEMAIDKKEAARVFMSANSPPNHLYYNLEDIVFSSSAACATHGSGCNIPPQGADMLIMGPPCAPFSTQRPGRQAGWL